MGFGSAPQKGVILVALLFYFLISHIISFLCSILEAVILSCTPAYIGLLQKKKSHAGKILADLKQHVNRPLAAILTLNTAAHTFGAAGVGAQVVEVFGAYWLSLASILVTLTMLYWTEMIPKTIGALYWKPLSIPSAYIIRFLIVVTYPFVLSFEAIAHWIGKGKKGENVTEAEIRVMIEEGARVGTIEQVEQNMVESIFRLGDRSVGVLMTPRREIQWIDIHDTQEQIREKLEEMPHALFPVCDGNLDTVVGMVRSKDLIVEALRITPLDLRKICLSPLFIHENARVITLLETFHSSPLDTALVTDEYGNIEGIVSLYVVLESILGELASSPLLQKRQIVQRDEKTWVLDGMLPIDQFKELFGIEALPREEREIYRTLGGFCLFQLGSIPRIGQGFSWNGLDFKILTMEGRRIDKILVKHR